MRQVPHYLCVPQTFWMTYNDSIHNESSLIILYKTEDVGHDFRRMCILLSRLICIQYNVLFLLTQRVDLGVHYSLWRESMVNATSSAYNKFSQFNCETIYMKPEAALISL